MTVAAPAASVARPHAGSILILSLSSACGCDCVFCGLPQSRPHTALSPAAVAQILDSPPHSSWWEEVNLTGGDPLVMPSARALFATIVARREKFRTLSVCSAGIPSRPAIDGLRQLAGSGPLELYVSLDGVGELHDRIRGRRHAFRHATTFLAAARELEDVRVALTCVINRLNVYALDELADYALELGLPISYAIVNESDHYIHSAPLYANVSLDDEGKQTALYFLRRRSTQRLNADFERVLTGGSRALPCRLLRSGFLVTSDGSVSICGTSSAMILGDGIDGEDGGAAWAAAMARRPELLRSGVSQICRSCTTNCYAWRTSDVVATG